MRRSRLVALIGMLALVACEDMANVLAVGRAVQTQYHMTANVNLSNRSHLTITFVNATVASMKLDSAGLDAFSRGVAAFAKAHYAKAKELEDVSVVFATVSENDFVKTQRSESPHRYLASELQ
jgi:hypothetical protein